MSSSRKPGTFWLIDEYRYRIDEAGRYHNIDTGMIPMVSLDDRPGIELQLIPVES